MALGTAQQMFVGGTWTSSATGETFDAVSPATGEHLATIPQGDREDVAAAVRGAASGRRARGRA